MRYRVQETNHIEIEGKEGGRDRKMNFVVEIYYPLLHHLQRFLCLIKGHNLACRRLFKQSSGGMK